MGRRGTDRLLLKAVNDRLNLCEVPAAKGQVELACRRDALRAFKAETSMAACNEN